MIETVVVVTVNAPVIGCLDDNAWGWASAVVAVGGLRGNHNNVLTLVTSASNKIIPVRISQTLRRDTQGF